MDYHNHIHFWVVCFVSCCSSWCGSRTGLLEFHFFISQVELSLKCYTLLLFILYSSALLHKSQPLQSGKKAGEPTMKSPLGALFLGNLSSLSFYFHGHSWPCLDFFVVSCFYNYSSDYVPIYFLHIIIQNSN